MHSQKPPSLLSLVNECSANNGYNAHREAFSPAAALRANIWPLFLMRTCLSAARVFLKHRFHQGCCSLLPRTQAAGNIIEECNSDFQKKRKLWNCPLHSKHIFFPSTWQIGILQLLLTQRKAYHSITLRPKKSKLNLFSSSESQLASRWLKLALPEATSSMSFKRRACFFHLRLCFDSNVAATWGVEAQVFEQQREVWPLFWLAASPEAEAGFW